jgi:hypothetical protein
MASGVFYEKKTVKKIPRKINIMVIRYNSNGELMGSKPCRDCIELLKVMGISRVYYSTDEHKIACIRLMDLHSDHVSWGCKKFF